MSFEFNGYNNQMLTFETVDAAVDSPVKMSSNKTVANCSAGNDFIGIVRNVRGGAAGVQLDGFAEMKYTGTAPSVGYVGLTASGTGGVRVSTDAAKKYKVLYVDTDSSAVGFIL